MTFSLLINVKMPTSFGILTFMSRKNSNLGVYEPEQCCISWYFYIYEHIKFHAQLSWAWRKFINLGPWSGYLLFAILLLFSCVVFMLVIYGPSIEFLLELAVLLSASHNWLEVFLFSDFKQRFFKSTWKQPESITKCKYEKFLKLHVLLSTSPAPPVTIQTTLRVPMCHRNTHKI